MSQFNKANAV